MAIRAEAAMILIEWLCVLLTNPSKLNFPEKTNPVSPIQQASLHSQRIRQILRHFSSFAFHFIVGYHVVH